MSVSELVLWQLIRQNRLGFKFRRQHSVGPYILNFYCAEAKICVEVDGEHHESRREKDAARDMFLENLGVLTIRVPASELYEKSGSVDQWLTRIYEA